MAHEHRTVSRVLGILETVARSRSTVTLSSLAAELDAPKSSLHGLVGGLVHRGYLSEQSGGYRLGAGAHALLAPAGTSLPLLLGETCAEIAMRTGETVTVAVRVGLDSVVYVHSEPSAFEVCYRPRLRQRRPILPTSAGKLFLARTDPEDRARVLATVEPEVAAAFTAELDGILGSGMAFNRAESVADVGAVAVSAYEEGDLSACLIVAGPISRVAYRLEYFGQLAQDVLAADGFQLAGLGTTDAPTRSTAPAR
ncbi:helix-turn-helix domain-containing protein [uncultured Brevibacterium sp.]|uniref:IclR family transcriptional regulator n=1 Tax=uncultured Brevibacterium sp. TaxID=189678 RepID=UPI0025E2652E|nr:helix-turn-helix domain-containing protein [uncultured Brevibacterium sp.]